MTLLMYGAGSIGRGFIAPLFAAAGYGVVFVDVDEAVVARLNEGGRYTVTIMAEPRREETVAGVRAVDGRDTDAVAEAIAGCDIMATALGAAVLPHVAPAIAAGLARRRAAGGGPLDILICENLKDAAHHLRGWLAAALPAGQAEAILAKTGLVEAAIGRMVPVIPEAVRARDPLAVAVEAYDYLPVDAGAFVGPLPAVAQLVPHAPFSFYEERKLCLHNMGHAICAYWGLLAGDEYIWQAVGTPAIRLLVQGAMVESASMLSEKYGEPFHRIYAHAEDLLYRFGNKALADTCARVGRDPMRKLAAEDRLAAPLRLCDEAGIPPVYIAAGMAAVLMQLGQAPAEARATLMETARLDAGQTGLVMELYDALAGCLEGEKPIEAFFARAEAVKRRAAGKTV